MKERNLYFKTQENAKIYKKKCLKVTNIMLLFSTKRDVVYGILTQVYVSKRIMQTHVTKNQRKLTNCAAANY